MEIKDIISKVKVYGLEEGIIASGNPMSVELSDCCDENVLFWLKQHQFLSDFDNCQNQYDKDKMEEKVDNCAVYNEALPEALAHFRRAKKLAASGKGEGHDQFLTSAIVQFNLKFTVKAWTEEERYHFIDFVSSQSTMHRIVKFNLDKAYIEYVDPRIVAIMKEKVEDYLKLCSAVVQQDIETITKIEEEKKLKYLQILYSNPCGFQLTARMTTNYRQLKTIYAQRKTHRLPEWRVFCKWIETLPYAKEFICGGKNVKKN